MDRHQAGPLMKNLIQQAKNILEDNIYLTLGTSGANQAPWVTPLFYSHDEALHFYWVSPKSSVHSVNILTNSRISLVVFNSQASKWTGIGVYMSGTVRELSKIQEIEYGLKLIFTRLQEQIPPAEDFSGKSEYRVYQASIEKVWITDDIVDDNGKTVDHRTQLQVDDLK